MKARNARSPKVWYKIVECQDDGSVKTLFHGVGGSRTIPVGVWLTAEEKMVSDGTSKTKYLSGFHVLKTEEDTQAYLSRFTQRIDRLKIVPVHARKLRPKAHSPHPVFLARYIKYLGSA